jgi:hypothetical protein
VARQGGLNHAVHDSPIPIKCPLTWAASLSLLSYSRYHVSSASSLFIRRILQHELQAACKPERQRHLVPLVRFPVCHALAVPDLARIRLRNLPQFARWPAQHRLRARLTLSPSFTVPSSLPLLPSQAPSLSPSPALFHSRFLSPARSPLDKLLTVFSSWPKPTSRTAGKKSYTIRNSPFASTSTW